MIDASRTQFLCSSACSVAGAIDRFPCSVSVFFLNTINRLLKSRSIYPRLVKLHYFFYLYHIALELLENHFQVDVTVDILIEIDKLVNLLESPVLAC